MEKLLTVVVPCYNSEAYMEHAVDSLLSGGERLEIIIVNDGSTDGTAAIAEGYAGRHPQMIRAIHQENGGHGDAVMTGLRAARGDYFRVLDSDDWVDDAALKRTLEAMEALRARGEWTDMFITNYVYDKLSSRHRHKARFAGVLPENRLFGWSEVGVFRVGDLMTIHAVAFRTQLLRDCGLTLPKHTSYEDNLFVYLPLVQVDKLYYLNADLYHYFIGRPDQSTQMNVVIRRIDQQLRINREMFSAVDLNEASAPKKRYYMLRYIEQVTTATVCYLLVSGKAEDEEKLRLFIDELKRDYPEVYRWFCRRRLSIAPISLLERFPNRFGKRLVRALYRFARWYFGFT